MFDIKSEKYRVICDLKGCITSTCLTTEEEGVVLQDYSGAIPASAENEGMPTPGMLSRNERIGKFQTYHCSFIDNDRLVVIPAEMRGATPHWIPSIYIINLNDPASVSITIFGGINRALVLEKHYLLIATASDRDSGCIQLFDLRYEGEPREMFFDSIPGVSSTATLQNVALARSRQNRIQFAQLPNARLVTFEEDKFIVWDVKTLSKVRVFSASLPEVSVLDADSAAGGGGKPSLMGEVAPSVRLGAWDIASRLTNTLRDTKSIQRWYHLSEWEVAAEFDGKLYCVDLKTGVPSTKKIDYLAGHPPYLPDLVRSGRFLSIDQIIDLGGDIFATTPSRKPTGLPPTIHVWSAHEQTRLADLEGGIGFGPIELRRDGSTLYVNEVAWSINEQRCLDMSVPYWQNRLCEAAHNNDMDLVEKCLARGDLDVNYRYSPMSPTPLHLALFRGYVEVAERLLVADADVSLTCETTGEEFGEIRVRSWTTLQLVKRLCEGQEFCGPRPPPLKQKALNILRTYLGDEGRRFVQDTQHVLPAVLAFNLENLIASIDAGGQIEYRDPAGRTLLHHLCLARNSIPWSEERLNMLSFLISKGLSALAPDSHGKTALEYAVRVPYLKGIGFTVSSGQQADMAYERDEALTFDDKRIQAIAILMGDKVAYQYLFILALRAGHAEAAANALKLSESDVNTLSFKPVNHSASYPVLELLVTLKLAEDIKFNMMRSLIALGAKFNVAAIAAQVDRRIPFAGSRLLELLSQQQASHYQLIVASQHGDMPEVERLLAVKADVNFNVDTGRCMSVAGCSTPILHNAVLSASTHRQAEVLQLLLAQGVSQETKKRALDHAKKHAPTMTQFFFSDRGEYLKTQLLFASATGDYAAVKASVDAGADVNEIRDDGRTAAQLAASYTGDLPIGTTALHFLCVRGELKGVKLLLEHGAQIFYSLSPGGVSHQTSSGGRISLHGTPLKLAMRAHQVEVVRYLSDDKTAWNIELIKASISGDIDAASNAIAHGADVNFNGVETYYDNSFLRSALFFSCKHNHGDIALLLIGAGADVDIDLIKETVYDLLDDWEDLGFGVLYAAYGEEARNYQLLAAVRSRNMSQVGDALAHGAETGYQIPGRFDYSFGEVTAWEHCNGKSYPDGEVWPDGCALLKPYHEQREEEEAKSSGPVL